MEKAKIIILPLELLFTGDTYCEGFEKELSKPEYIRIKSDPFDSVYKKD